MTSMAIADAADADNQISAFLAKCREHDIPCRSFHFGSGYSMHDGKRYAFRWNREKFPDPAGTIARIEAAGMRAVTNLKPCLLDDHPRLPEVANGLVKTGQPASPRSRSSGMASGITSITPPEGRDWWRAGMEQTLLAYGVTTIWNDNNEYEIWDEDAICAAMAGPSHKTSLGPRRPC